MKNLVIGVSMVLVIALIVIITLVVLRLRKEKARKLTRVISLPSFSAEQLRGTSFSPSLATAGQTNTIPPSRSSKDQEEVVEFEMDRKCCSSSPQLQHTVVKETTLAVTVILLINPFSDKAWILHP